MVLNTAGFLREKLGAAEAARVFATFSPPAQQVLSGAKVADWCDVSLYMELLNAIASLSNGNQEQARDVLISTGEHVAREATNSFLRLLMNALTPNLFARKLPEVWKRDCTGGRLEVDVSEHKLVVRLYEMQGFDHVPCTATGFIKFALEAMGKSVKQVKLHDWSLGTPFKDGSSFELIWANS
jgi:hypothetical protein